MSAVLNSLLLSPTTMSGTRQPRCHTHGSCGPTGQRVNESTTRSVTFQGVEEGGAATTELSRGCDDVIGLEWQPRPSPSPPPSARLVRRLPERIFLPAPRCVGAARKQKSEPWGCTARMRRTRHVQLSRLYSPIPALKRSWMRPSQSTPSHLATRLLSVSV